MTEGYIPAVITPSDLLKILGVKCPKMLQNFRYRAAACFRASANTSIWRMMCSNTSEARKTIQK